MNISIASVRAGAFLPGVSLTGTIKPDVVINTRKEEAGTQNSKTIDFNCIE